jgi:hypothetical protein
LNPTAKAHSYTTSTISDSEIPQLLDYLMELQGYHSRWRDRLIASGATFELMTVKPPISHQKSIPRHIQNCPRIKKS